MKKYHHSFDSSSRKPAKILILAAFIVLGIFYLGKDCANYDRRHATSLNITR